MSGVGGDGSVGVESTGAEPTAPATKGELILRITSRIHTLDPVRTEPDWTGMIRAALEATDAE